MRKPVLVPRLLPLMIAASLFLPVAVSANEPVLLATGVVEGSPESLLPVGVDMANMPSLRAATSDTASLLRDAPGVSLDGAGGASLAKTSGCGSFTASGWRNYSRGESRTSGDNLYNIMPLNAKLAVVQRLGSWTHTVEAHWVDAKRDMSQVRNELETAGYGLLHLRSSDAWKQARLDIGIENVLDKLYNHRLGRRIGWLGSDHVGNSRAMGRFRSSMGRSI